MGNNKVYFKMLISSIVIIILVFILENIFGFNRNTLSILFGSSALFVFISALLYRLALVYQDLFYEYDAKYLEKYGEKLVLTKNDKYILKYIIYTVHDRRKSKTFIHAFKEGNQNEIDEYLFHNNYKIEDIETFNKVMKLISEYLNKTS